MRIKISKTAGFPVASIAKYSRENNPTLHYNNDLYKLRGKTVEVETDYLFADQFNVAGLRVMAKDVERVINDKRPKVFFTRWTNKNYPTLAEMSDDEKKHAFKFVSPLKDKRKSSVVMREVRVWGGVSSEENFFRKKTLFFLTSPKMVLD